MQLLIEYFDMWMQVMVVHISVGKICHMHDTFIIFNHDLQVTGLVKRRRHVTHMKIATYLLYRAYIKQISP